MKFALLGAAGFVAPRHLQAIKDVGGELRAVCDPHDSVGVIDRYFPGARYFPETERFDRFLEKDGGVQYVSVCTPNFLHDAHCRLALRSGADAICEKPLVINPWNLDQLERVEEHTGHRVWGILQLRLAPQLIELREQVREQRGLDVHLSYETPRGSWYRASWKGDEAKSGGLVTNLGIHMLDLLLWLFGAAGRVTVYQAEANLWSGALALERANVVWKLSTGGGPRRSLSIRGVEGDSVREIDLSAGFEGLHTRSYEHVLAGQGHSITDARPAIELAHRIRSSVRG